jgi:hypothetical protein
MLSSNGLGDGAPGGQVQPGRAASTTDGSSPPPVFETGSAAPAPVGATIKVSADKSARVRIDGRFAGWSPLGASVEPGKHTIQIGEGARVQTIKTQVAAGDTREIFVNIRHPKE